jgi:hypothetical protein
LEKSTEKVENFLTRIKKKYHPFSWVQWQRTPEVDSNSDSLSLTIPQIILHSNVCYSILPDINK